MSIMDEITYWIYTKRAPCLMNYDNLLKKQSESAQCSKDELRPGIEEVPSPKKRKKRKLSLLDEDSVSTEKQQNVYFEVAHNRSKPVIDSSNSETLGSDVDFNIKNTSVRKRKKRTKLQKNSRGVLHKKNKVVTSTPKSTVHLRRSLRQAKLNNSALLNPSFDVYNISSVNGANVKNERSHREMPLVSTKQTDPFINGEQTDIKKNNSRAKNKYSTLDNGEYGDLSDVSGFTATYIRSTKVQSHKNPKKLRSKNIRNLMKQAQCDSQNDTNLVVCINKSTNTGDPNTTVLNCSTDSSQNVINLVSIKPNNKIEQTNKGTSLLKFMNCKKSRESLNNKTDKQKNKPNLNISFQSQSSRTSRYPKRNNRTNTIAVNMVEDNTNLIRRGRGAKNCIEFSNSDKKENPEEIVVTRTRSGRIPTLSVCQRENSVLVVSNSTEQVSSMVSMNVASPNLGEQRKKRRTRQVRSKISLNKSLRDKSGFAQCFSESEDDSEPLVQRKYFCT